MEHSQTNSIYQIDKENLINILTDELPTLRARIGIKQEELSDILGISRQTYSAIETKKKKYDMEYVYFFAYVFYAE